MSQYSPQKSTFCTNTENRPLCRVRDTRRSVRITYATHQPLPHQRRVRISRRDHAPAPIRACRGEHCSSAERSPKYGTRRCKFVPGWVCEFASACCIFFVFTADGQWPPLHTDTHPSGGRCSYGCTYVRNFSETPIRFFLRGGMCLRRSGRGRGCRGCGGRSRGAGRSAGGSRRGRLRWCSPVYPRSG